MGESLIEASFDLIDLWQVDLKDEVKGKELLSSDESVRADKFVFPADRSRFIRSRSALRLILSRYLDYDPGDFSFRYNEHGKPELSAPPVSDLRFNLSHSAEVAVIAVASGRNVGVDINTIAPAARQNLEWIPIAKRSFSDAEQVILFSLPDTMQERMFHQIWCQKEAYTKGLGEGYRYGFQNFTVAVDSNGGTGLIADEKNPRFVEQWRLTRVEVGQGLMVVLAYDGMVVPQIRQHKF